MSIYKRKYEKIFLEMFRIGKLHVLYRREGKRNLFGCSDLDLKIQGPYTLRNGFSKTRKDKI